MGICGSSTVPGITTVSLKQFNNCNLGLPLLWGLRPDAICALDGLLLLACIFNGRLGQCQVHPSVHAALASPIQVLYFHIAGRIDGFVHFRGLSLGVIVDPIRLGEQPVDLMLQVLELGDFSSH